MIRTKTRRLIPAAGLTAVLALVACGHDAPHGEPLETVAVRTQAAEMRETPRPIYAVGSVRSEREAVLASKVMGTVIEIRKSAGERVRKGEVVLVVDSRELAGQIGQAEGALAQAKAAAVLAETNRGRYEQLFERGAASQAELDQARYQHETARGAVTQAEGAVATAVSYRRYAEIPAPFDGQIVDRMIEVGDMASPGRPLMKVEDPTSLRLHATLPEAAIGAARAGAEVPVRIPALGEETVRGTVAEVVPALDPATRSLLVKIDLPETPGLRSGLYGRAAFDGEARPALLIPKEALRVRGGLEGVFVAEEGHATFRLLTVRDPLADPIEVLTGLSAGDQIIVAPPPTLQVGQPVEVRS